MTDPNTPTPSAAEIEAARNTLAYKIATEVQGGNPLTVGWKRVHDIVEKHVAGDDAIVADMAQQIAEGQQAAYEYREERIALHATIATLTARAEAADVRHAEDASIIMEFTQRIANLEAALRSIGEVARDHEGDDMSRLSCINNLTVHALAPKEPS